MSSGNANEGRKSFIFNHHKMEKIIEILALLTLILYPLRHIFQGVDLQDTGYNYANFAYMGLEHMDSMWLFSTYLANAVGHLLTFLPYAGNLAGMNFYTGLFVSLLSVSAYFFCTRSLKIPKTVAFVGEMTAISLCWCPTALLYNYLGYVLFLACVILLYEGLVKKKKWLLFAAGACLAVNILVRFSNLVQPALILAVWGYAISVGHEEKAYGGKITKEKIVHTFHIGLRYTEWCVGGYLSAFLACFAYIQARYGVNNYVAGIRRLFAMTDTATDYKATSMVWAMVHVYWQNSYWLIRLVLIAVAGMAVWCAAKELFTPVGEKEGFRRIGHVVMLGSWCVVALWTLWWLYDHQFFTSVRSLMNPGFLPAELFLLLTILLVVDQILNFGGREGSQRILRIILPAGWGVISLWSVWWLYSRSFFSGMYYSYDSMFLPGVLFLMLTMLIAAIRILHPKSAKEEKLISGLLILVILLTSIGSNNNVFPSLNNLFVAAPYTFWQCNRFFASRDEGHTRRWGLVWNTIPVKGILIAFLGVFLFQSIAFGANFVFVESTGARNMTAQVNNNKVLKGVWMSPDKAEWLEETSAFLQENALQDREVILYGNLPALSYYLQLPSAFNPWSDLDSYRLETMEEAMNALRAQMSEQDRRPLIIAGNLYVQREEGGRQALRKIETDDDYIQQILDDPKWTLISEFMKDYGYEKVYQNEKFAIWK